MDKTWMDVLIIVVEALVGLVITVGIPYLFALLRSKVKIGKVQEYMSRAEKYLTSAVTMVNQTFVEQLKRDGEFNEDNQMAAFRMAMDAWLDMMNEEMKSIIINEVGNFETWAEAELEAKVNQLKQNAELTIPVELVSEIVEE